MNLGTGIAPAAKVLAAEERRARVLAIFLSAVLARYARDQGQSAPEREALAGLERALID